MRFVQGIDYGPRDGTLGLSFHMSEGYDNLPGFLARHSGEDLWEWAHRVSGVSCNAAILSTGEVVQMLDWGHASGNLNPDDRAGEYGYYGHSKLVDVLGGHWPDPNTWLVSAELAGFRSVGPTDAQVRSAIAWGRDMRRLFPTIRGAVGHHDQSTKPCPGLTSNMRAIFDGVGGHGLFRTEDDPHMAQLSITDLTPKMIDIPVGAKALLLDGTDGDYTFTQPYTRFSPYGVGLLRAYYASVDGKRVLRLVTQATVRDIPEVPAEPKSYVVTTLVTVGGHPVIDDTVTLP